MHLEVITSLVVKIETNSFPNMSNIKTANKFIDNATQLDTLKYSFAFATLAFPIYYPILAPEAYWMPKHIINIMDWILAMITWDAYSSTPMSPVRITNTS